MIDIQQAIKILREDRSIEGLESVRELLKNDRSKLADYGHDQLIFKHLMQIVKFDDSEVLNTSLDILDECFFAHKLFWDEMLETILFRTCSSSDETIINICLSKISKLVDHFDASIAKHSMQISKLNYPNDMLCEILTKIKAKLPTRCHMSTMK